jgi:hypothetical protein
MDSPRDGNSKANIHTSTQTGEFSHWNGQFHCHAPDACETRKRSILAKIKARVLDEYIPVKIIVEEEYRMIVSLVSQLVPPTIVHSFSFFPGRWTVVGAGHVPVH